MLVVEVHAKNETRSFEFDQSVITIGRADVNDIVLPTAKVSKRHARLEATPQGLILTDIKSTNGTYLNGRKVLASAILAETDRVHIGEFVITVQVSSGLPMGPPPDGFPAEIDSSAATEPNSGLSPELAASAVSEPPKRMPAESESVSRRGAAHRISWLDQWASNNNSSVSGQHKLPTARVQESNGREVGFSFVIHASMPAVVPAQRQVALRLWADARGASRIEGGARQRLSGVLEVNICLPDGKLEAFQTDQGMLQVLLGGHSADLLIPLRGREIGPARVEVAICHRGARLTTLMLRPEVRTLHSGDSSEPLVQSEIQASTPLETVLPGCGPQAVLRVREYGPIGEVGEERASTSGSHGTEASRRRRLKVELGLVHDETVELIACGESPIDLPLADRVRAALSTQEVERLGTAESSARESMLQSLGELLAQQIIPANVREALLQLQPGTLLQVDCAETWVPWELLRVGKGLTGSYLAERFAFTRSGSGSYTCRFEAGPRVLITPKGVETMVRREHQCLAMLDVRLRQIHRVADLQPLLAQGGQGGQGAIAGWHFSGQGSFDRGDKSAASLHLEDGVLTPVQIVPAPRFRKSGQTPPFQGAFIFINVSEPSPPPSPLAPAGTVQWIERFLSAGAGAVVATTWPIGSAKAAQFVEMFYRAWSQNRPLAVAISEARESVRSEGDVTWLAFAVYGLPGARHGTS